MAKITQTAGRNALGTFAPEFAHFNDDVLFGENWNNEDIDLKTRSIITVVAVSARLFFCFFLVPNLFCKVEYCPALWPSCIECYVSNNRCDFFLCYPMILCIL